MWIGSSIDGTIGYIARSDEPLRKSPSYEVRKGFPWARAAQASRLVACTSQLYIVKFILRLSIRAKPISFCQCMDHQIQNATRGRDT